MAKAEATRIASPTPGQVPDFYTHLRPAALYELSRYCAIMAAREVDYRRRRRLEQRARALGIAARRALAVVGEGRR